MEIQAVSTIAIIGLVFSTILSIGFPIACMIAGKKKYKAKLSSFFIGAATFLVFAMILEQILHVAVIGGLKLSKESNEWLYYIYAAAAAAVFEETGRIVAMKFFMKKQFSFSNAFMYGIGHGGVEAIFIGGIMNVFNVLCVVMINSGVLQGYLETVLDETRNKTIESLSSFWTTPSSLFFASGIERVSAVILHIGLSLLIYKGLKECKKAAVAIAYGLHFAVDFVTVACASRLSIWVIEVFVFIAAAAIFILAYKMNKGNYDDEPEEIMEV